MSKHTPGPWRTFPVNFSECTPGQPGIDSDSGRTIVVFGLGDEDDCGVHGNDAAERVANARLIAAAPDLLQALQAAVARINNLTGIISDLCELGATVHVCGSTYNHGAALAALAKAGQS